MDQVVVVRQNEGAALLDLQAVLVARHLLLAGAPGGGKKLSAQPGLVGHLRKKRTGSVSVFGVDDVYSVYAGKFYHQSHLLMQQPVQGGYSSSQHHKHLL